MAEAIGWIDLAIIDGTYRYMGEWKLGEPLDRIRRNLLIVGKDPVAVETVGSIVTGGDPCLIPAIVEAKKRNIGESDINRIEVVGESIENATLIYLRKEGYNTLAYLPFSFLCEKIGFQVIMGKV